MNRRRFLSSSLAAGSALAATSLRVRAQINKNSKLRVVQIGVGGVGGMQRKGLKDHPMVEWAGFCDVDATTLKSIATQHPDAFAVADYREAFASHADKFDAVIVDTPDFHHAPMMITALKHNKHIYGQKPLVHQLDELRLIRTALKARPGLFTQMGNQRACIKGRMQAVELLRKGQLGKPVEAHIWTGSVKSGHYFSGPWSELPPAQQVPGNLNWDLWNGPLSKPMPYHEEVAPRRWRSWWQTGGGQLADWGCHLIDLLYFAYDLPSPEAVQTNTIRASNDSHSAYNQSTITYPGGNGFAREKFVLHYNDDEIQPSFAALGLPHKKVGANHTMVVCEDGVLLLEANGKLFIYRKGKLVENEPLPEVEPRDHWKDWADCCLGNKKPLWTPFEIGSRITEPALLAVKATRYPGEELRWDAANYRFTNHDQANKEILSRQYRDGFAPPQV